MKSHTIFLFTDYRGQFYSSTRHKGASVDLERLKHSFRTLGHELDIRPFSSIDFRTQNYKDKWVLYQSSEDPGRFYRDYVEDVILGLFLQGARLIPDFLKFRAHHNKHFMEIVRDLHHSPEIQNIQALRYGTFEDYARDTRRISNGDFVLKASDSSKSRGVSLMRSTRDKIRLPKKVSRTPSMTNLRYCIEGLKTGEKPLFISNHRNKFILQPFIDGLPGDYRVVIYGDKFYVLSRENRPDDFRASGSGRFDFNRQVPEGLLDYARTVFKSFDVPFMAMDIGLKQREFYLFEFQFLSFGQYTLEKSGFFYRFENNSWSKVSERPDLEREIAASVAWYILRHARKEWKE